MPGAPALRSATSVTATVENAARLLTRRTSARARSISRRHEAEARADRRGLLHGDRVGELLSRLWRSVFASFSRLRAETDCAVMSCARWARSRTAPSRDSVGDRGVEVARRDAQLERAAAPVGRRADRGGDDEAALLARHLLDPRAHRVDVARTRGQRQRGRALDLALSATVDAGRARRRGGRDAARRGRARAPRRSRSPRRCCCARCRPAARRRRRMPAPRSPSPASPRRRSRSRPARRAARRSRRPRRAARWP